MGSLEKRTRTGQLRWYARYRDRSGKQLVKVFDRKVDAERFLTSLEAAELAGTYVDVKRAAIRFRHFAEEYWAASSPNLASDTTRVLKRSRGVSVVAVSRWLGHSSPEITYRIYACPRPDDETAGRAAMAETIRKIIPGVYRMCTQDASGKENPR